MAETILTIQPFAIAFAGGVLPSLLWLWFWLREDRASPEPKGLIALSFAAGMAVIYFVIPIQKLIVVALPALMHLLAIKFTFIVPPEKTVRTILWALTEEFGKFATVFLVAYHTSDFDEPMDCIVYLITAALGFAAMENTLYILKDIANGGAIDVLLNSNLRFIGATIVHTASSALLGVAFAFAFYENFFSKVLAGILGLILATFLHTYFNLSIIETQGTISAIVVFSKYWLIIFGIIALIEIVKHIKPSTI
jgi:RsiW-degrading membrane proteinase PrsW (M82 family)